MTVLSAQALAATHSFSELAQILVQIPLFDHEFAGCLIAEIGEDARIREAGRYGILGPGPSTESVPLWDSGLIAAALKKQGPTLISSALDAAKLRKLAPTSDIDELSVINSFESIVVLPLRHSGLLTGVIGLCSITKIEPPMETLFDYTEFQAMLRLATRSIAYGLSRGKAINESNIKLTDRDNALLSLIARGFTNKEIAKELSLSLPTVKLGVSSLLSKLSASTRQGAAENARLLGLI